MSESKRVTLERLRVWVEAQCRGLAFTDRQAESFDALRSDFEAAIRAESDRDEDIAAKQYEAGLRAEYQRGRAEADERVAALRRIAKLAIDYVEDGDASWQEAKDPHETDDDLEPSWVAFRDAVRAALSDADPEDAR